MRRLASIPALLTLVGCTEPEPQLLADITNITAPTSVAASDTLRVAFIWTFGGCEKGVGVSVSGTQNGATFTATKEMPRIIPGMNCPSVQRLMQHSHNFLPSQRSGRFTLTFRQPSGVDSVRVVQQQP